MSDVRHKFFRVAAAMARDGGFGVALDGRGLRTPGGAPFVVPCELLADACAREWDAQQTVIQPHTMPLTRLVNVALDHADANRAELVSHVRSYAATDLVAHRADGPAPLTARQAKHWDPLIAWAESAIGARLPLAGLIAAEPEEASLARIAAEADALDRFALTGLAHAAGLAGSAVIAFALQRQRLDGREAFEAACLDDLYSLETWGEDEAARERLEQIYLEFLALQIYFAALKAG
jgi:chaperone required for assembly of F1-ATPase